jgi:hypothetical protein
MKRNNRNEHDDQKAVVPTGEQKTTMEQQPLNDRKDTRRKDTEFDNDLFAVRESKLIQVNRDDDRSTEIRRIGQVPQENLSVSEYSNHKANPKV